MLNWRQHLYWQLCFKCRSKSLVSFWLREHDNNEELIEGEIQSLNHDEERLGKKVEVE